MTSFPAVQAFTDTFRHVWQPLWEARHGLLPDQSPTIQMIDHFLMHRFHSMLEQPKLFYISNRLLHLYHLRLQSVESTKFEGPELDNFKAMHPFLPAQPCPVVFLMYENVPVSESSTTNYFSCMFLVIFDYARNRCYTVGRERLDDNCSERVWHNLENYWPAIACELFAWKGEWLTKNVTQSHIVQSFVRLPGLWASH